MLRRALLLPVLACLALVLAACGGASPAADEGAVATRLVVLEQGERGAPWPVEVHAPTEAGTYPVAVFFHGFLLAAAWYRDVLDRVAAQGIVVVAPQLYEPGGLPLGKPSLDEEAGRARAVLAWLPGALDGAAGVDADTGRLALAGHSRGGSLAWRLALADPSVARAVAGVDPVDGGGPFGGTSVLESGDRLDAPTLVLGAGLVSSCAPEGRGHAAFAAAAGSPAWHLVLEGQGHTDVLDDDPAGCGLACTVCPSGGQQPAMREATATLLGAFLRLTLADDEAARAVLDDPPQGPIRVTAVAP